MIHIGIILISTILAIICAAFIYLLIRVYCIIVATRKEKKQRRKEYMEQSKVTHFHGITPTFSNMQHDSIIRVQLNT